MSHHKRSSKLPSTQGLKSQILRVECTLDGFKGERSVRWKGGGGRNQMKKRTGKLASGVTKEGLLISEQAISIVRTHSTWFLGRILTTVEERLTL